MIGFGKEMGVEGAAILGLVLVIALIASGMLFSRTLAAAAFPRRVQLFELASDLLAKPGLSVRDRAFLNFCMDNALSAKAGWTPVKAAWWALRVDLGLAKAPHGANAQKSAEVSQVGVLFIGSVLFANPVALIIFGFVLLALMLVERQRAKPALRHTAASLHGATC
jgi:hypothetical protein